MQGWRDNLYADHHLRRIGEVSMVTFGAGGVRVVDPAGTVVDPATSRDVLPNTGWRYEWLYPETDFLAVEVYRPGVAQTLQRLRSTGLTNVRIMQADAALVLGTAVPAGSVDEHRLPCGSPLDRAGHHDGRRHCLHLVRKGASDAFAEVTVAPEDDDGSHAIHATASGR